MTAMMTAPIEYPTGQRRGAPGEENTMKIGDRVSWATPQGRTHGTIAERRTRHFQFEKQHFVASEDDPRFIVESEKTGARAAHSPSALRVSEG